MKNSEGVSGGQGMALVVRITGGPGGRIEVPFMIFQNEKSNNPIRGVPDYIPRVCYRTSKSSFMNQRVWAEWMKESRAPRFQDRRVDKTYMV